jgi:hypothetical protein
MIGKESHEVRYITATTLDETLDGAADKLTRLIEHTLGRLREKQSHRTDPDTEG